MSLLFATIHSRNGWKSSWISEYHWTHPSFFTIRVLSWMAIQFPSESKEYSYSNTTRSVCPSSIFLASFRRLNEPRITSSASHQKIEPYSLGTCEKLKFRAAEKSCIQPKYEILAPYFRATASTSGFFPVMVMNIPSTSLAKEAKHLSSKRASSTDGFTINAAAIIILEDSV